MKYIKMLGLAAVVASAAMAFIGTGTAFSATVLCTQNEEPCSGEEGGQVLASGVKIQGTASNMILESWSGGQFVNCTNAPLTAWSTAESGEPALPMTVSMSLTGTECTHNTFLSCTTSAIANQDTSVESTGTGNGTLTSTIGVRLSGCNWGAECEWRGKSSVLDVEGGAPAQIVANHEPLTLVRSAGGFCEKTQAYLTATYSVLTSEGEAVWVSQL